MMPDRFGHPEVDDLDHGPIIVLGHQHIRRFDVPVDDAFLVRVLDSLADRAE